jgi:probable HAF family extracellular repeat protein
VKSFIFVLLLATWASAQAPVTFNYKNIPLNYQETVITGVNNLNQMTGYVGVGQSRVNPSQCFTRIKGVVTKFRFNGTPSYCLGINNKGVVLGYGTANQGAHEPFLYSNGQFTDLRTILPKCWPMAMNDKGDIVGWDGFGWFLWDGTNYKTFQVPGATGSRAVGINNLGHILVVWYDGNQVTHSSIYDGSKYTDIVFPGHEVFAVGIDETDDVVLTDEVTNSYLFSGGTFSSVAFLADRSSLSHKV